MGTLEILAILDSIKTDNRELAAIEVLIMLLVAAVLGYILRGFVDNRSNGMQGSSDNRERRHAASAADSAEKEDEFSDEGFSEETSSDFDFDDDDSGDDFDAKEESDSEEYGDFFDEDEEVRSDAPESEAEQESKATSSEAANDDSNSSQSIEFESKSDETSSLPETDEVVEIDNLELDPDQTTDVEIKVDSSVDKNKPDSISHFAPKVEPLQTSPIASFRAKDDLKRIEGVGPKIESILNSAGIKSYSDLANSEADTVNGILREAGSRFRMHDATSWPEQAKLALNNEWDALDSLQSKLKRGK